jgi:hypothetical protein
MIKPCPHVAISLRAIPLRPENILTYTTATFLSAARLAGRKRCNIMDRLTMQPRAMAQGRKLEENQLQGLFA